MKGPKKSGALEKLKEPKRNGALEKLKHSGLKLFCVVYIETNAWIYAYQ